VTTVALDALEAFSQRLLEAAGAPADIAAEVAHHLVAADAAGHASHGVIHLPSYLAQVDAGDIVADARPSLDRETDVSASVDGGWGFGHFAAKVATQIAVDKAATKGLAAVALGRTGHIGRLGEYSEFAAARGTALIVLTAPIPGNQVAAPGGAAGILGTNPIAIGFPSDRPTPFSLDYATSATSGGKIWLAQQRGEELPPDVLLTADLEPTRDPAWLQKGAVFPAFGGHKGFALALAIALLGGTLTGAAGRGERPVEAGTLLLALHAGLFGDARAVIAAADAELARIDASPTTEPGSKVVIPGEPEAAARRAATTGGVDVTAQTRSGLEAYARRVGVDPSPIADSQ
jgi:uncharacterized oxidoreductase